MGRGGFVFDMLGWELTFSGWRVAGFWADIRKGIEVRVWIYRGIFLVSMVCVGMGDSGGVWVRGQV